MCNNHTSFLSSYHDILTVDECAEALQICSKQVRKLLHAGDLGCFRIGNAIRIPKVYVEDYICRQLGDAS